MGDIKVKKTKQNKTKQRRDERREFKKKKIDEKSKLKGIKKVTITHLKLNENKTLASNEIIVHANFTFCILQLYFSPFIFFSHFISVNFTWHNV